MGIKGLVMDCCEGSYGLQAGLTKSTDHPSCSADQNSLHGCYRSELRFQTLCVCVSVCVCVFD